MRGVPKKARLAFAISTCIEPDILLLDEGVGAGDKPFLDKAQTRLEALIERAGILVLTSHSEELMQRVCNKAVLMERGRVVFEGPLDHVLARYNGKAPPKTSGELDRAAS